MFHALHITRNDRGQETGRHHKIDINGVLRPANWVVAQHHIADGAATQSGHESNHHDTEDVHIAPPSSKRTGHGFGGDGDQIDEENDVQLHAEQGMEKVGDGRHNAKV